uniref:GG24609 n=1 Tax=Drosophila erecta TaxID=7220 RepID=B3P003_DROER
MTSIRISPHQRAGTWEAPQTLQNDSDLADEGLEMRSAEVECVWPEPCESRKPLMMTDYDEPTQ